MKEVNKILVSLLLCLMPVICMAQTDCLEKDFIKITTFTNGKVGDLVAFGKNESPSVYWSQATLEEAAKNVSKLSVDSFPIHDCISYVSSYTSADLVNLSSSLLKANLKKNKGTTVSDTIKNGYKKSLREIGTLDDLLSNLDEKMLKKMLAKSQKSKLMFITEAVYNGDAVKMSKQDHDSTKIELEASLSIKKDTTQFQWKPKTEAGKSGTTTITSNPDIPVAYHIEMISSKDISKALSISYSPRWHSFIPFGYRQYEMGNKWCGSFYAATTTASLGVWGYAEYRICFDENFKYLKNKSDYKTMRTVGGIGVIAFWLANIADGLGWFGHDYDKSTISFAPAITPGYNGIGLTCNFK